MTVNDVHGLGLNIAQGLIMTDHWYWDLNDKSRAFGRRFFSTQKKMPTSLQAADYSAVRTYLKAIEISGTDNPEKVMATLKKMKIDDSYNKGYIREDGRFVHDMYVLQAKSPTESKAPWDYLRLLRAVPGEEAFRPPVVSRCSLLKK